MDVFRYVTCFVILRWLPFSLVCAGLIVYYSFVCCLQLGLGLFRFVFCFAFWNGFVAYFRLFLFLYLCLLLVGVCLFIYTFFTVNLLFGLFARFGYAVNTLFLVLVCLLCLMLVVFGCLVFNGY